MDASRPAVAPTFAVRAICFDLLSALLDSWTLWEAVAADAGRAGWGRRWRETALRLVTSSGDYRPYREFIVTAARDVGLDEGLADHVLARWAELRPWPEVPAMLAQLSLPLATATNCAEELAQAAVQALDNPFTVVVSAERAGAYKPDPRPYQLALAGLGLPPEQVLFVAGSAHDAIGAAAIGMPVVWVNRLGIPHPPGVDTATVVRDLTALPGLLR